MTCTGYRPLFQAQLDGTRWAGANCTCASAGMACDDNLCGARKPSSSEVRFWTGDTSGGTNLAQVDAALRTHTATDLDTRYRYPWSEFVRRVNAGQGAILQGYYSPIADSRFDAGRGFRGNHAIYVNPGLIVMDPLADGRYPGVYKYHGERYPEALLRRFAGLLNLEARPGYPPRPLGDGFCYAAFTRDNDLTYTAHVPKDTDWTRYTVVNGRITGHTRLHARSGWTAPCTPPRLIGTASGNARVSLVQVTKAGSPYNGFWVSSRWSDA